LKKRSGVDARLLDLRDFPMPFFDQPVSPATPGRPPYENEVVKKWTAAIAQSDGFVFVTPEYNYGPAAVLKNAIDWVYPEWNRKAAGFVSYGSALGARSVQQLREPAIELQLAPVRSAVHIPVATPWAHYQGGDIDAGLAALEAPAGRLIDDLAVVDRSLEDGARQRVLTGPCAAMALIPTLRDVYLPSTSTHKRFRDWKAPRRSCASRSRSTDRAASSWKPAVSWSGRASRPAP
jgi:NAD(P)H-dependent FMN reductase